MVKEFNTTGACNPEMHYMVDTTAKLVQIEDLINHGKYFTINCARQFGKTTTLDLLFWRLQGRYKVISISFESDSVDTWSTTEAFCNAFLKKLLEFFDLSGDVISHDFWHERYAAIKTLDDLSLAISHYCKQNEKSVLLFIDEVDKSQDNQIFLCFLGMLRNKFLQRNKFGMQLTFQSIILAGVYDVKNLKLKIRGEEERKYNSPWNIAADFPVDMSFSPAEIRTMLAEYESDHHTGMDQNLVSDEIYKYTSGYPYLVSKICEIIDIQLAQEWTPENIVKAVKNITKGTSGTLVDDISKNMENNKDLRAFMYSIAVNGMEYTFTLSDPMLRLAYMFAYVKDFNGKVVISNIIFEEVFHQYFTIDYQRQNTEKISVTKSDYVKDGRLNMPFVIERFQYLMRNEYRKEDEQFIERQGRLLFLCFIKPIINGTGFYYVEPQTRSNSRMDLVVTYGNEEFVIELKIWRGTKYEESGRKQLADYLNTRGLDKGYLVTFSFLKDKAIQDQPQWENQDGKQIYEAVI